MKVNEELINTLYLKLKSLKAQNEVTLEKYEKLKNDGASKEVLDELYNEMLNQQSDYNQVKADLIEYNARYENVIKLDKLSSKTKEVKDALILAKDGFYELENQLLVEYCGKNVKKDGKKSNAGLIVVCSILSAVAIAGACLASYIAGKESNNIAQMEIVDVQQEPINEENENDLNITDNITEEEPEEKAIELGEPGTFTDANDEEQILARAQWYFDKYFNEEFKDLGEAGLEIANVENLADGICVGLGQLPIYSADEFSVDGIIEYDNKMVTMFSSYLSTTDRDKVGFVPSQYRFVDGSYEQKCAAQVDAVMKNVIKAINEKDDENFVKYTKEFGQLMINQYFNVQHTDDYYAVRGSADFESCLTLWSAAYAEYTNKIVPYQDQNKLDICVPFCVDYNTGETVEISLSKLMSTLETVPMKDWDHVLQKAGITLEELQGLGVITNEMPVQFTMDAKSEYKSKLDDKILVLK